MNFPEINWVLVGSVIGVFWGLFAVLFYRPKAVWRSFPDVMRSVVIIIFQFFFQFIGGFAGAMGLGLFLDRYSQGHLEIPELILLAISLVGVSGKLSDVIYRLPGYMGVAFGPKDKGSKQPADPHFRSSRPTRSARPRVNAGLKDRKTPA